MKKSANQFSGSSSSLAGINGKWIQMSLLGVDHGDELRSG